MSLKFFDVAELPTKEHGAKKQLRSFHRVKITNLRSRIRSAGGAKLKLLAAELAQIKIPRTCPLSGAQMQVVYNPDSVKNQVSLDRIDNNKPYQLGNVWWVSTGANQIKRGYKLSEVYKSLNRKQRLAVVEYLTELSKVHPEYYRHLAELL